VRCPWCDHEEDRVVDSRPAEGGSAIRRRRECLACSRRYTTFERVDELGLMVVKRDGTKQPYDRNKVLSGLRQALANRPVDEDQVAELADRVGERLRGQGPDVTSQEVGLEVLSGLKRLDQVAYLRFASVYKDFQEVGDFEREVGLLLQKREPAKRGR
jgi:transcriptional repressor NrdR